MYSLLCVGLEEMGEVLQSCGGDLIQQTGELVLPLLTVTQDGELER